MRGTLHLGIYLAYCNQGFGEDAMLSTTASYHLSLLLPPGQVLRSTQATTHALFHTKKVSESCSVVSNSLRPHGLYSPWNSPGQNTGVGSLSLLQGSFPTQGLNPGLTHCRHILYQVSHKASPRIPEWVAFPFSSGYS